jgi:hypothetical protein
VQRGLPTHPLSRAGHKCDASLEVENVGHKETPSRSLLTFCTIILP